MFGDRGNKHHDDSIRIIHRALDAGINFIDTADIYSQGESEVIDWIDLYQIHRYEPGVDLEETLGALTDLVQQGKVRYSDPPPSQRQRSCRPNGRHATSTSALRMRATALLDARPRDRSRHAPHM